MATWYGDRLVERGSDAALELWPALVGAGLASPARLVESCFHSHEFRRVIAPVVRLYLSGLGRLPDNAGFAHWTSVQRREGRLEIVSDSFCHSEEFRARYAALDLRQFVESTMCAAFGAHLRTEAIEFWSRELEAGNVSRGRFLLGISEHPDFRVGVEPEVRVTVMYLGMLRRPPDPEGLGYWVGCARQGDAWRTLIEEFLGSPECRMRFRP